VTRELHRDRSRHAGALHVPHCGPPKVVGDPPGTPACAQAVTHARRKPRRASPRCGPSRCGNTNGTMRTSSRCNTSPPRAPCKRPASRPCRGCWARGCEPRGIRAPDGRPATGLWGELLSESPSLDGVASGFTSSLPGSDSTNHAERILSGAPARSPGRAGRSIVDRK
jgi:hypothetical protein